MRQGRYCTLDTEANRPFWVMLVQNIRSRISVDFATDFSRWYSHIDPAGEPASAGLPVTMLPTWLKPLTKSG